jgi:hypothetical protein
MSDNVNHPTHYQGFSNGAEVIDITENLTFNLGNVVKYVARAGRKTEDPIEDLHKAKFYLEREISRIVHQQQRNPWSMEVFIEEFQKLWAERTGVRSWDTIEEVPLFVVVVDSEGDLWRYNEGLDLQIKSFDGDEWETWDFDGGLDANLYAPFREVKTHE